MALNFKSLFPQVYFHCLFHKHKITKPSKCYLKLIITEHYPYLRIPRERECVNRWWIDMNAILCEMTDRGNLNIVILKH